MVQRDFINEATFELFLKRKVISPENRDIKFISGSIKSGKHENTWEFMIYTSPMFGIGKWSSIAQICLI